MRHLRPTRVSGFTLLEILVVITVIALLMAILGVAVTGVRHRAQEEKTISLLKKLETAIHLYVTKYNNVPPVPPATTVPADTDPGGKYLAAGLTFYLNSAYLHYYLGSGMYEYYGYDASGTPKSKKLCEPLCDFQKSDVSTWDRMGGGWPAGKFDASGNIVAENGAAKGGILLDAWKRAIAYVPCPAPQGNYTVGVPFPRPGQSINRPGRNLTGTCVFWSRGLDGVSALPTAGATAPTAAAINSVVDGDGDGKADNLDDIANWFLPYY